MNIGESVRGVLLAGGTGSRLLPLTAVTNKHLLPVGDKPMIEWPLRSMIDAGVKNIMVVTGREHAGAVFEYLGNGSRWEVELTYRVQETASGIAHAFLLAEDFCGDACAMVMLGDNIFGESLRPALTTFLENTSTPARVLVTKSLTPQRFGVVELKGPWVTNITEKPRRPKSRWVQTGCYFYWGGFVFDYIRGLALSKRGELEITDLNMSYVKRRALGFIPLTGYWSDAGTPATYYSANKWANSRRGESK